MLLRVNKVALRNTAIIAALAGLGMAFQRGPDALVTGASQLILVLFVAAMLVVGYQYFREHKLAWLVLRPWQRAVIVTSAALIAIVALAAPWLGDVVSPLGVMALIAALVLIIVWVIRESRRLP